jgi:molecular chaperone GrpE
MSEPAPPAVPADASRDGAEALTSERIDAVLADFRVWLQQAATGAGGTVEPAEAEPPDLHTLLSQFVALRHEVNLQTRATRGQQEQNAETLRRLAEALDALKVPARTPAAPNTDDVLRPFLKTLVDVFDALLLAGREAQRVRETVLPLLETVVDAGKRPVAVQEPRGFWSSWFGGEKRPPPEEPSCAAEEAVEQVRRLLDSLVTGYGMSLRRVERTLQQAGLERIDCVGEPFDPERMEVLEVMTDTTRPAGEVIEEVRPGYLWNGRIFRYAQVRVARPTLDR